MNNQRIIRSQSFQTDDSLSPVIELLIVCKDNSIAFYQDGKLLSVREEPWSSGTPEIDKVEWYFWTAQDVVSRLAIKTSKNSRNSTQVNRKK